MLKYRSMVVDAEARFMAGLDGVTDPEKKRKFIGAEFINVFEEEAKKLGGADFLAQGTLYPDVIESVSFTGGPSVTIKSHHNVGGLPERMNMALVEPLRELFKDEVRVLGRELGLPDIFVGRHPFPGPGLAIRIPGVAAMKPVYFVCRIDWIATISSTTRLIEGNSTPARSRVWTTLRTPSGVLSGKPYRCSA